MHAYLYCFPGNRPQSANDESSSNVSDPTFTAALPKYGAPGLLAQSRAAHCRVARHLEVKEPNKKTPVRLQACRHMFTNPESISGLTREGSMRGSRIGSIQ